MSSALHRTDSESSWKLAVTIKQSFHFFIFIFYCSQPRHFSSFSCLAGFFFRASDLQSGAPTATGSPRNMLEIAFLGPHPDPPNQKLEAKAQQTVLASPPGDSVTQQDHCSKPKHRSFSLSSRLLQMCGEALAVGMLDPY